VTASNSFNHEPPPRPSDGNFTELVVIAHGRAWTDRGGNPPRRHVSPRKMNTVAADSLITIGSYNPREGEITLTGDPDARARLIAWLDLEQQPDVDKLLAAELQSIAFGHLTRRELRRALATRGGIHNQVLRSMRRRFGHGDLLGDPPDSRDHPTHSTTTTGGQMTHPIAKLAPSEFTSTKNGSTLILTPTADTSGQNRIEYTGESHANVIIDGEGGHTVLVRGFGDPEPTVHTICGAVKEHFAQAAVKVRLERLSALAETHDATGSYDIEELLNQKPADGMLKCPRFVAVAEHADQRTLFCDDNLDELITTLREIAFAESQERPEEIIDLDTEVHHKATLELVITFTPPLPGREQERFMRCRGGERSALKLLCDIAEEHAGHDRATKAAIATAEDLLQRAYPTKRGVRQ
jgi:hypothetical protein